MEMSSMQNAQMGGGGGGDPARCCADGRRCRVDQQCREKQQPAAGGPRSGNTDEPLGSDRILEEQNPARRAQPAADNTTTAPSGEERTNVRNKLHYADTTVIAADNLYMSPATNLSAFDVFVFPTAPSEPASRRGNTENLFFMERQ